MTNFFLKLQNDSEYRKLLDSSAKLGADALQVQGPGGNTSIKMNGAMWIKASGTWLVNAKAQDIMVPVNVKRLVDHILDNSTDSLPRNEYVPSIDGAPKLSPSIETSVHAILNWPVVLHTHCVNSIAVAVRVDAADIVKRRMQDLNAVFIPYTKPGDDLARAIANLVSKSTRVLILGNHGVVTVGDTVTEAVDLLSETSRRLSKLAQPRPNTGKIHLGTEELGENWIASPFPITQSIAFHKKLIEVANGSSLYPDHAVFLGPGCTIAQPGESADKASERASGQRAKSKLVVFPDKGVAVPRNSNEATLALVRAFGDVVTRIDPDAELIRLTQTQEDELVNWDAEKHRQAMSDIQENA